MKRIVSLILIFFTFNAIGSDCIEVKPTDNLQSIVDAYPQNLCLVFNGDFTYTKRVSIVSENVTITGTGTINFTQADNKSGLFIKASKSLNITGINFKGANNSTYAAVYIYNTLGKCVVDKCSFTNFKGSGINFEGVGNLLTAARNSDFAGFKLTNTVFDLSGKGVIIGAYKPSEYWIIDNCTFNRLQIGVTLGNAANGTINNSFFTECSNYGIYQYHLSGNAGKMTISSNKFNHNSGVSIFSAYLSSERPFVISANQFIANSNTDIEMKGDRHAIIGNQLNRSGAYYIKLYGKKCIVSINQYWQGVGVANFLYAPFESTFIINNNLN